MAITRSDGAETFPGDSEMARLMRAHPWAETPLGDPQGWPEGLKVALRMLLTSRFEMWLGWGPELRFFYNDAYIPTLGIKHPSMLGEPFHEVWAEVYADVADQVARVRAGEATWNKALLLLLERSGYSEETYHSFSYSPLYDADATVGGMLCVVSEETERVIGERRLETLRRLGMSLVGCVDEAAVTEAVCRTFGDNRRDFPFALLHLSHGGAFSCSEDAVPLLDHVWDDTGDGIFPLHEGRDYPTGAWERPPHEALRVPIPGLADQPRFGHLVLGLNPYRRNDPDILDFARLIAGQISGALANVSALKAERRRADRIWSHSRDLMVIIGADGVFRSVSPAWTRILGHKADDVVGQHYDAFVMPDDLSDSAQALASAIGDNELTGYENRFRTLDGGYRWISWHTAMEDGLVYAYGRDITEQKENAAALARAEDALRQSQKMEAVGQLTGGIAHDFNNLLTGIIGSLDMMQRRIAAGRTGEIDRYMDAATTSANRAASLTQRLLAFSRRQSLDPRLIDPNMLVRGMEDLIRHSIGEAITLSFFPFDTVWPARCDPHQLESAILNLAINARDAMPQGGQLLIETANTSVDAAYAARHQGDAAGDYVTISVHDTGHGMSADTLAKVFEPFFTTKPIGQGTGLGLSMIYGFARQSHGFVEIESEIARGTTVRIHLPRAFEAPMPESARDTVPLTPPSRRRNTILVVEDEAAVRALVVDVLQELGCQTLEAEDGPKGLDVLRSDAKVDLLVTDVGLPGLNGRQLAEAGRVLHPGLKVLFLTGYSYDGAVGDSQLEPGMEIITKPFAVPRLAERVRALLD